MTNSIPDSVTQAIDSLSVASSSYFDSLIPGILKFALTLGTLFLVMFLFKLFYRFCILSAEDRQRRRDFEDYVRRKGWLDE